MRRGDIYWTRQAQDGDRMNVLYALNNNDAYCTALEAEELRTNTT